MTNLRQQVVSLLDPRRQDRLFQRFDAVLRIVSEKVYQARQITDLWLTHEVNWHMVSTVYSGVKRLQQNYVKNGQNQAIRIPREFVFRGFNEVTLYKEGSCIIIEPVRKSWLSYTEVSKADTEFMTERPDLHNIESVQF